MGQESVSLAVLGFKLTSGPALPIVWIIQEKMLQMLFPVIYIYHEIQTLGVLHY